MTLFGSKKGYSKSDINFFEEFSASARKQTQVLAVIVFIGIIAIGLCLAVLGYYIVSNIGGQKDIDDLNAKLASDEYAGLELRAQALQQEITEKNQYYFTLTEMRRIIDTTPAAETALVNLLGDCIPSDAYVSTYTVTGDKLDVGGVTFSYYDAANICYLLNQSNVFSNYVIPSVTIDDSLSDAEGIAENPIDIYYDFTISGNLVSDSVISITHYATSESGVIALSGVASQTVDSGSAYEFAGIVNYSANGISYTLSSVSINGVVLSEADFAQITAADKISGEAVGNIDIDLYYVANTTAPAETTTEGGV